MFWSKSFRPPSCPYEKKRKKRFQVFFCQNRFFVFVLRTKKIFVRDAAETFADDEKEAELTKLTKI